MARSRNCERDGHSSRTPVARRIKQPTRMTGLDRPRLASRVIPIRSCSRWGLPCRFHRWKRGALLPHRFTLAAAKRNAPRRSVLCGTVPGVQSPLARRLAPPDVIRHRLSLEPGLSSPATFRHWRGAAVRPTDGIGMGIAGLNVKRCSATGLRKPHNRLLWGFPGFSPGACFGAFRAGPISPMARGASR